MGVTTAYLAMYLPADSELFDEQLNTNTSLQKVDAGVLAEHNGWTAHAAAPSPHTGHAVFTANTFTGVQTIRVAADAQALVYDAGALVAAGVQTGERVVYRAHSYDVADHHRDFMWRARTTTNAGNGVFELLTLLDAQAPPTVLQSIDQAGNMTRFGTQTYTVGADIAGIVLDTGPLAAAGVQTGERVVYRANSYDVANHQRDFVWRPRSTTNAGAGIFELLTLLDGGAQAVVWSVDQAGNVVGGGSFTGPQVSITGAAGLGFTAASARITGDFSNATVASRVAFQSSVVNGQSSITVAPNGTSTTASLELYAANTMANTSRAMLAIFSSDVRVVSDVVGTGTYLPLTFYTSATERMRITAGGQVTINPGVSAIGAATLLVNAPTGGWYAAVLTSSVTTSQAFGVNVFGGSNSSDYSFAVQQRTGSANQFLIRGDGAVQVGTSGVANSAPALSVYSQTGQYGETIYAQTVSGSSFGMTIYAGYVAGDYALVVGSRDTTWSYLSANGAGSVIVNPNAHNVSGIAFSVYGGTSQYAQFVYGSGSAGTSSGLVIYAGYNSSDNAIQMLSRDGSLNYAQMRSDGYFLIKGPVYAQNATLLAGSYAFQTPNAAAAYGQGIAQSWITYSSINNKSGIERLGETGRGALDLVHSIRGVRYLHHNKAQRRAKVDGVWDWVVDHEHVPTVGFVGEEVMPHLPEVVSRDGDGNMGLDYGRMVPVLWEAVKELAAEVAALKAQTSGGVS